MGSPLRVLLVDDSDDDALLLVRELERRGYEPVWERVETAPALTEALGRRWELVLCDYVMPRFDGPAALRLIQERAPDLPVIVVSGQIGEEFAVAAMRAGARDYVMKDNLQRLGPAVARELGEGRLHRAQEAEVQVSAALARVGQGLIAALDQPSLLETLCRLTTEVLQCDSSHTVIWDSAQQQYTVVGGHGDTPEQWESLRVLKIPRFVVEGLTERLRRDEVAQVVMAESANAFPFALPTRYGVTVGMYVGLRRGDTLIGVHSAGYRGRQQRFTVQQERIFRGIAQLGCLALEHARTVEELTRANRLKYDFVATMSHELRTPLNVILGYSDLLLAGEFGPMAEEQADIFRRIDSSARQLLDLITATLDLSRLEGGTVPLEIRDVRLPDLFREVEAETSDLQTHAGVCVKWQPAEQLPQLRTDPLKLKVVLKNLISNALKFTDHGGVTVSANRRDGGVEVAVSDTGIGIAPEARSIIFEPFRQVDSSMTRRHGGVGLGLYISRRLVDLLAGKITVESEPGAGSTFRVWLPIQSE